MTGPRARELLKQRALRIRSLRRTDWPNIERLFGNNGACGGCWCMTWRLPRGGRLWDASKGLPNKRALRGLVSRGEAHGLLAFSGREPVGWCSFGPRSDFPKFANSRTLNDPAPFGAWVVTCFVVAPAWRGSGVATALLRAAVGCARGRRASVLDGYPARPKPSARLPAAFASTGVPTMFTRAGFHRARGGTRARPLMRHTFKARKLR